LGTVFSGSAARQVIAKISVPANSSVSSVQLTAVASAANLVRPALAALPVAVSKAASAAPPSNPLPPAGAGLPPGPLGPLGPGVANPALDGNVVSQLPVGALPLIGGNGLPTTSLSPGGNASGLFPAVNPTRTAGQEASARPVADTEALPIGAPVIEAQLAGLGALGIAFLLAVTRLSIRRRPAAAMAGSAAQPDGKTEPARPADGN
jgi:hypothetical protein